MPHAIHLEPEVAADKGRSLVRLIEQDIRDRKSALLKQQLSRNTYYGAPSRQQQYDGQSNIELRVVAEKIEAATPKIVNAFWNTDPVVNVSRWKGEPNAEQTDDNEAFMNYQVNHGVPDLYATTEMWFRNTLLDGVAVVHTWYNYKTRDTVVVEPCKTWWVAGDIDLTGQLVPQDRQKTPVEILVALLGPLGPGPTASQGILGIDGELDPTEPFETFQGESWTVDFIESRQVYYGVHVEFWPSRYVDEVDVYMYRPIVVKNNVEVDVVEYEDLIVPYRTQNLQTSPRVTYQYWLTIAELEKLIAEDGWDITDGEFKTLKARALGERQEEHPENDLLRDQKDDVIGESGNMPSQGGFVTAPYRDDRVLIFAVYATDDVRGPLSSCEMIYHIPYGLRKIVRSKYLEEEYPHGRRPFADLHYIRISDRYNSLSMAEILAPIQIEVNAIINMVNEAQELVNNPWFAYVPSALTVDPEILRRVAPGTGIPIGDPNGLIFPHFPQQPLANLSALDSLLLFADRLTVSPQSSGSSQVRNSPRTARGTLALLSEAGIKSDMFITSAQRGGWRELMHQIHGLEAWFGDQEKYFLVTGSTEPRHITQKEMRGRFEYTFNGNSVNTNREVMRSIAQVRFNTLAGEPLYQMDLEARQRLVRDFLRHFSEGINVDDLVPRLPQQGAGRLPMSPQMAVRTIIAGMPVSALPTEDHQAYVDFLSKFAQTKEFEQLAEWQATLIGVLLTQHQQLLVTQVQQGGQPGGPGQGNNISTKPGNLEGGIV